MKLWAGRFSKEIDQKTNDFNSSIKFDSRMIEEDIKGSIAHATMLGACGIIEQSEAELICKELEQIYKDIQNETLPIDPNAVSYTHLRAHETSAAHYIWSSLNGLCRDVPA